MALLSAALEKGHEPETLEKFMDLAERWKAGEARAQFEAAMCAAQADFRTMKKTGRAHNSSFFTIGDIRLATDDALKASGLSYRWKMKNGEGKLRVTCVLAHVSGHYEETTLETEIRAAATKGANDIQVMGSAQTYLQRYTLMAALGLSAGEHEDDGRAAGRRISSDQYQKIAALIEEKGVAEDRVLSRYGIGALHELPADKFADCVNRLAMAGTANGAAK